MIDIIKRGTKKQIICRNCGALLSYEEEDIKTNSALKTADLWISCPQCNEKITIKAVK